MSFYPAFQHAVGISPAVRGLARLIEGGKWTLWCGDGAWRSLTPPMAQWECKGGLRGLREGRTLRFSRHDRDVEWPVEMYGARHPLNAAEKELLYAIYERDYLIPERERVAAQRKADDKESQCAQQAWQRELEQAGRTAA